MLNAYQTAFIAAMIVVVWTACRARVQLGRQVAVAPRSEPSISVEERSDVAKSTSTFPTVDAIRDRVRALDKLFDDNVISVEEYVELRRRAVQ